eukprot:COSAG04_NODE_15113_length_543_cov_0.813063_2_plen_30_part_01
MNLMGVCSPCEAGRADTDSLSTTPRCGGWA